MSLAAQDTGKQAKHSPGIRQSAQHGLLHRVHMLLCDGVCLPFTPTLLDVVIISVRTASVSQAGYFEEPAPPHWFKWQRAPSQKQQRYFWCVKGVRAMVCSMYGSGVMMLSIADWTPCCLCYKT